MNREPAVAPMTGAATGAATGSAKPAVLFGASLMGIVSGPSKLLGNTGAALIGNSGAGLVGNSGGALAGNSGGALAGNSGGAYRLQAYQSVPASGSILFLTTPDEELYRDPNGQVISTTTDSEGRYTLPADVAKPLLVTAMLAHNRRLVGYTLLASGGSASLDVSLESTYATEFLRYEARKRGKSMADFDLAKLRAITSLTRTALDAGDLDDAPSLAISEIPALVQSYLLAFATRNRALSDAWTDVLGYRPLAVSSLPDLTAAGHQAIGIATRAAGSVYASSFSTVGMEIRASDRTPALFRGRAALGYVSAQAIAPGPDGLIYFAMRFDRHQGGVLAAPDRSQIRLFSFDPADGQVGEGRLPVVADLAAYAASASVLSAIEPTAMAWRAGKLYLGDSASGQIFEYEKTGAGSWAGSRFAGTVEGGLPLKGYREGARLEAKFGAITHLTWRADDLFVSDPENGVIRRVGADGMVTVFAGTPGKQGRSADGTPLAESLLAFPKRLLFDAGGRAHIADGDNHRVLAVENGRIRTLVDGGAGLTASGLAGRAIDGDADRLALGIVDDMAFDSVGNLLFTDAGIGKVRKLWLEYGR